MTTRPRQDLKDREAAEVELKQFSIDIHKQAATLQNYEVEQRKLIAELEKRINDRAAAEARIVTQIEQTKTELVHLDEKRSERAQEEVQLKHWQEIEKRLRGQRSELEKKHEILRRGLGT